MSKRLGCEAPEVIPVPFLTDEAQKMTEQTKLNISLFYFAMMVSQKNGGQYKWKGLRQLSLLSGIGI